MKYYISTAFRETKEIIEIVKAADDLGYDGVGIPDHVINLETLSISLHPQRAASMAAVHRLARPVGARRRVGSGDDAIEVRDDGVYPGDA